MLRLLALFCLAAASAGAQERAPERPTAGQRVLLVVGSTAGGAVGLLAGPFSPLAAGAATYGTSAALGFQPTVGGVVLDTAAGAVVALAVYGAGVWTVTEIGGAEHSLGVDLGWALAGLVAGGAATGLVHGARLSWLRAPADAVVAPVAWAAPTGERGAGLSVRVGL